MPKASALSRVRDALARAEVLHHERNQAPYDGVLGKPPSWFPPWHANEFRRVRNSLLDEPLLGERITAETVRIWIHRYEQWGTVEDAASTGYVPPEVTTAVGVLAHYRWVASLDPVKGLSQLGGPYASSGYKSANSHKARPITEIRRKLRVKFAKHQSEVANLSALRRMTAFSEFDSVSDHTMRKWLKEDFPSYKPKQGRPRKPR
jgi:hypothetical protein